MIHVYQHQDGATHPVTEVIVKDLLASLENESRYSIASTYFGSQTFYKENSDEMYKNTFHYQLANSEQIFKVLKNSIKPKALIITNIEALASVTNENNEIQFPTFVSREKVKLIDYCKKNNIDLHMFVRTVPMLVEYKTNKFSKYENGNWVVLKEPTNEL